MATQTNFIKTGWGVFRNWTNRLARKEQKRKDEVKMVSSKDQSIAFIFFNCDFEKSQQSMNILYNNVVYKNLRDSRRALWDKVKEEISLGHIQLSDENKKQVRYEILEGDPTKASQFLTYGAIIQVNIY